MSPNLHSVAAFVRAVGGSGIHEVTVGVREDVTGKGFGNQKYTLTVDVPASAHEGDGTVAGTVSITAALDSDLSVALASNDTSEATVTASVIITAGDTSVGFDLTVIDDGDQDGTQVATVTASATGLDDDTADIDILDNDIHHFEWDTIADPQQASVAFSVTVSAKDIDGVTVTTYTGTAGLTAVGDGGGNALSASTTGAFTAGVWTGSLSVDAVDTNVALTATDGGIADDSNAFDVQSTDGSISGTVWEDLDGDGSIGFGDFLTFSSLYQR